MLRMSSIRFLILLSVLCLAFAGCQSTSTPPESYPPSDPVQDNKWDQGEQGPDTITPVGDAPYYNNQGVMKRIHFETDKWEILPEYRATLKDNATWLLKHPEFKVTVEGHCDERNTDDYNMALGERRANAIREYLIGLGVPSADVGTISYGETQPLDPGQNEAAYAKNRRGEFLLKDRL